jgi:hypothetical protein
VPAAGNGRLRTVSGATVAKSGVSPGAFGRTGSERLFGALAFDVR